MDIPGWLSQFLNYPNSLGQVHNTYWIRTSVGIEDIVLKETCSKLNILKSFKSHRNVFVQIDKDQLGIIPILEALSTADDVFEFYGSVTGIGRAKATLNHLLQYFQETIIPKISHNFNNQFIRVTFSFVGKRNFNRYLVEEKLNKIILENTTFTPLNNEIGASQKPGELRMRCHLENECVYIGIGLKDVPLHRRSWRNTKYVGQLHPPVAAAMVQLIKPSDKEIIIDPFCGSGTILLESILQHPNTPHFGYDHDKEAIEISRISAARLNAKVKFEINDAFNLSLQEKEYYLLTNPPWNKKHKIIEKKDEYFIEQLLKLISNSIQSILLLPEDLSKIIANKSNLSVHVIANTRVRGQMVKILKITRS